MALKHNPKKIMVFVDWFTPGYKGGGPIQSCRNFTEALKEDFDIYLVTSDRDLGDAAPYPALALNTWIQKDGVQIYYATLEKLTLATLRGLVIEVKPAYLYLNSMFSYKLTLLPLLLRTPRQIGCQVVLAPRGMLQEGAIRFKRPKKIGVIRLLKLSGIPKRLVFHATDKQEEKDIRKYFPEARNIFLAPNFPKPDQIGWEAAPKEAGRLRCIFLSRVSPKKNLLFFLKVLQEIPESIRIDFSIYGEVEEQDYWQKCKAVMAEMPASVNVRYQGAVNNQDIFEVYKGVHVFVLPTLGENFGHAVFEALLAGKPVVISDKTPWQHLAEARVGFDIPLSQPGRFREAVEQFAQMTQTEYNEWSHAAAGFAQAYRNNKSIKEPYLKVFVP